MIAPPAPPPQSDNKTGFWFVHDPRYQKYAIAGVPIVIGVLLFLAFFVTSWVSFNGDTASDAAKSAIDDADAYVEYLADLRDESEDDVRDDLKEQYEDTSDFDDTSASAWKVWTGGEDAVLRVDEDYEGEDGFGEVETRDRLIIFELLFSIGLIAIGVLYLLERLDQRRTLIATAAIALFLFLFPLFWEGLKGAYVSSNLSEGVSEASDEDVAQDLANIQIAVIKSAFATFEFVFLSFIALLFSVGTYLILQSEHKRLGTSWPPPINPFAGFSSGRTAGTPPPAPPPSSSPPAV